MRGAAMPVPAGSLRLLARTWCCLMMLLVLHCDTVGAQTCPALPACSTKYDLMLGQDKKECAANTSLILTTDAPKIKKLAEAVATTTTPAPTTKGDDSGQGGKTDSPGPKTVTTKKPDMTDAPALATRTALSKTAMAAALMMAGSLTGTRGPALILTGLSLAYTVSSQNDSAPTATHLVVMYTNCDTTSAQVKYNYIAQGAFGATDMLFAEVGAPLLAYSKPNAGGTLVVEIYDNKVGTLTLPAAPAADTLVDRLTFGLTDPEVLNFVIG